MLTFIIGMIIGIIAGAIFCIAGLSMWIARKAWH